MLRFRTLPDLKRHFSSRAPRNHRAYEEQLSERIPQQSVSHFLPLYLKCLSYIPYRPESEQTNVIALEERQSSGESYVGARWQYIELLEETRLGDHKYFETHYAIFTMRHLFCDVREHITHSPTVDRRNLVLNDKERAVLPEAE